MARDVQFEIALSFAGEDRPYVAQVANLLRSSGVKVFYDLFEESSLWGKNLYDYLSDVYQNKALYTIMFISKHYAGKLWPTHERQAMQARAFQEQEGASLSALSDNNIYKDVVSCGLGIAKFSFQTRRRLSVLIAHPERPGALIPGWDPADDLRVILPDSENTGSVICHSTGYIPGLVGRLNPILDTHNRMYLYADNIAIRGGEQQPC